MHKLPPDALERSLAYVRGLSPADLSPVPFPVRGGHIVEPEVYLRSLVRDLEAAESGDPRLLGIAARAAVGRAIDLGLALEERRKRLEAWEAPEEPPESPQERGPGSEPQEPAGEESAQQRPSEEGESADPDDAPDADPAQGSLFGDIGL